MASSARSRASVELPPGILFDLDDTLFDHRLTCRDALASVRAGSPLLRRLSLAAAWQEYLRALEEIHPHVLAGRLSSDESRVERFRILARRAGGRLSVEEARALARRYRARYEAVRRPVPGAVPFLRRLRGRTRIGVVTNSAVEEQEEKLRFLGLDSVVDTLVVSAEVGTTKPDPGIFRIALQRLGVPSDRAVMVGDSWINDVEGALAAGIRPVWFNRFRERAPSTTPVAELRSFRSLRAAEELLARVGGR